MSCYIKEAISCSKVSAYYIGRTDKCAENERGNPKNELISQFEQKHDSEQGLSGPVHRVRMDRRRKPLRSPFPQPLLHPLPFYLLHHEETNHRQAS